MRVLLTRPESESAAVARRLGDMGFEAIVAPVIAIVPRDASPPIAGFDAILVTSAHATAALSAPDRQRLRDKPVLAVGAASAAAARRDGFLDVRIAGGDAASLRDLVRLTLPAGARLVYLAGRVRKPALADGLTADGHPVSILETYDAQPAHWSEATVAALRDDPPGACLHFSRRSAELFVREIVRCGLSSLMPTMIHSCLSDDVAVPLWAAGATRVVVAERSTVASLSQALANSLTAEW